MALFRYSSSAYYNYADTEGNDIEISREQKGNQVVRTDIPYCCIKLEKSIIS